MNLVRACTWLWHEPGSGMNGTELHWQPSLLGGGGQVSVDGEYRTIVRIALDEWSWVEHEPSWVLGADRTARF